MPIPEAILNQMKCCFLNDGHIAVEPIIVNCGANACQKCVIDSTEDIIKCFSCKENHTKKDIIKYPTNKLAESMVQTFLNDLFEYVDTILEKSALSVKENTLIDEFNSKIQSIENEMDIRVESLVASIHDYRDECKKKLDVFKEKFKRIIPKDEMSVKQCESVNNSNRTVEILKEKQNELKKYQLKLNEFKEKMSELQFTPSKFQFSLEQFGDIQDNSRWSNDSLILSNEEFVSVAEMTESSKRTLLYRATRDGFEAQSFHNRCDGKSNTISIIKNNLNYVFGGFASSAWCNSGQWINDPNAFIFSLRRNGISSKDKFMTKSPQHSLYGNAEYGPTFGQDIDILNNSNVTHGQYSSFGSYYNVPTGKGADFYLGGSQWLTSEIEVYLIN